MKKIGIVGGIAWLSTVDYYSEICRRSEQHYLKDNAQGPPSTPEMTIESLDINRAASYIGIDGNEASWVQFDEYHRAALKRLEAAGANFALIASNTPHHRFDSIVQGVRIPIISILKETAMESARIGAAQVLILGTAIAMSSQKFRDEFVKVGIEAAGPKDELARDMTIKLIAELQLGKQERAAERLRDIAKTAFKRQFNSRPVVCLACTELPSAFQEQKALATFELYDVVFINTAIVHANAAFDFAIGKGDI